MFTKCTENSNINLPAFLHDLKGDVVKGQDASDAAYERMKELAMMKQLREAEADKAEQDEQERRNREKRVRDER